MEIKKAILTKSKQNRPGRTNTMEYITIHETGNYALKADAQAHSSYLRTTSAKVSWHYSVDENEIYQHIPDNEVAFHAGTADGNNRSIGIEICVNADGNFNDACTNAIWLTRKLMAEHNIPIENVVQHNHWNGKNCPENLRLGGWSDFIARCAQPDREVPSDWAKEAWEKATLLKITDGLRPHDPCTRQEIVTMLYRAGALKGQAS